MDSEKKRKAEQRLSQLFAKTGPLASGILAVGQPLSDSPAAAVARHLLGNLPSSGARAPRLTALLAELQRADAQQGNPATAIRDRKYG